MNNHLDSTSLQQIESWLVAPRETEHLEFKEAKAQYSTEKILRYCVALANEGGGKLVLGVTDKPPRQVVGSNAFANPADIQGKILHSLGFRVDVEEVAHPSGRVVVFHIPPRPAGRPYHYEGAYLMRSGEEVVPMTEDRLRQVFSEGQPDWLTRSALAGVSADDVVALLDTQSYFDLMKLPYPTSRDGVIEKLITEGLIERGQGDWTITNMGAILFAKKLSEFPAAIARKAARVVLYDGVNKTKTKGERLGVRGYAAGFSGLLEYVHTSAPQNKYLEEVVREEVKMFPLQALRELIANALIHQDFEVAGASVMVEMYSDRVEISNPGRPPIEVDRFIDEYVSRNERLAGLMRRLGICEEKGSGVDKVVSLAEMYQLPAPDFRVSELRTIAVLFVHQGFAQMSRPDRTRACYQHCCLRYISNQRMTNQSLRERFGLPESKTATASQIIAQTKDKQLIKPDETESQSTGTPATSPTGPDQTECLNANTRPRPTLGKFL